MHLLIDGVAFQRGGPSAAGWGTLLEQLARQPQVTVTVLDRGGAPGMPEVHRLPFPQPQGHDAASDSLLIQRMCDQFKADIFLSTGTTSPVATPALAVLPLCLGDDGDEEGWPTALAFAQHYVCTSEHARARLVAAFPATPAQSISTSDDEPAALARAIRAAARELLAEAGAGCYDEFFKAWTRIRALHAAVGWHAT